ncbi:hypothetical protein L0337_15350 [candidate division KSB1 bacterium]|nr:hypothetical protein [candidate division KSB1 bacterium]
MTVILTLNEYIIGCDKDAPLGVDHQAGPEKQISAAMNGDRIFTSDSLRREIRVVDRRASKGDTVKVPIQLAAQGDENGFTFSLAFDPAILRLESDLNSFSGMRKNDVLSKLTPAQAEAASVPQIN